MHMGTAAVIALLAAQLSYGPFVSGPRDHSFAVSVAPHGMLVAWSEIPENETYAAIHVGLIDFDGQLISPIRTLAPFATEVHVTSPQIATDGERFFVIWIERDRSSWLPARVAGTIVDSSGAPFGNTINLGRAGEGTPALVWNGLTFRVDFQASHSVTPHGVATRLPGEPATQRVPFATPEANGWVDWSDGRAMPCYMGPGCYGHPGTQVYQLQWTVLSSNWFRTGAHNETGYVGGRPAVLAQEDDLLVIWRDPRGLLGMPIVDGRAQRTFRLTLTRQPSEPAAAESLVVFETGGDIYGVPIVEGRAFGEPFAITTTKEFETLPRVYLVGPNRYLVTWVADRIPSRTYLGAEFVTLPH